MATVSFGTFMGMIPLRGEQKRPAGASQFAENCNLESADLMPILSSQVAATSPSSGHAAAFRVPASLRRTIPDPPPASELSADDVWVWFGHPYSHFHQTPVTNDQYNRWYWTEEGQPIRYAPLNDLIAGRSYELGIPRPEAAPTVEPSVLPQKLPLTFFDPKDERYYSGRTGMVDVAYFRKFLVEGGLAPYVFEVVSGALPPSIALSENEGTLAGVPSAPGTYTCTIRVTDEEGSTFDHTLTIGILASPYIGGVGEGGLVQRNSQPPNGVNKVYFTHSFAVEGGRTPRAFRVIKGALPPGLVLTSQGVLYGVPSASGYYKFDIEAFDAQGLTSELTYDIQIYDDPLTPESPYQFVTRCYVYTYVSKFGEESAPSEPMCAEGAEGEPWFLSEMVPPSSTSHVDRIRIYRTVTGDTGGSFFFVAEQLSTLTAFVDTVPTDEASANEQLKSDAWAPPLPNLVGLQRHPNGFFVAYTAEDSTLHFSEPYQPHAWPAEYDISVAGGIQGIAISSGQIIVLTTTAPYVLTGTVPAALTLVKSDTSEPCISRQGIVSTPQGVFYPSKNGIVATNGLRVDIVTRQILSFLDWQSYKPSSLFMARHQNTMVGIPLDAPAFVFAPQVQTAQFTELNAFGVGNDPVPDNLQTDPYTQEAYWVEGGVAYWFNREFTPPLDFIWLSSEFVMPRPLNWGAFGIDLATYERVAPSVDVLLFSVEDGRSELRWTTTVTASGNYRLPLGYKSRNWQLGLVGTGRVQSIKLAETMLGLAEV